VGVFCNLDSDDPGYVDETPRGIHRDYVAFALRRMEFKPTGNWITEPMEARPGADDQRLWWLAARQYWAARHRAGDWSNGRTGVAQ
jgi:hypothetical protein